MIWPRAISAYVGINGSGKTLGAIAVAIKDQRKRGRPIITNVDGLRVEHYLVSSVQEIPAIMAKIGTCTVVLDEAGAMFPSRDGSAEHKAFRVVMQQLRKFDARLIWTAPAFARGEKIMREVTMDVILCRSGMTVHQQGKVWPSTRLIVQKRFDVSRLDNSAMTINRNAKAKGFGFVRTGRWQNEFDSFATTGIEVTDEMEEIARLAFRPRREPRIA